MKGSLFSYPGWFWLVFGGCLLLGAPVVRGSDLPRPVAQALAAQGLSNEGLSLFVQELGVAKPLVDVNADQPMNPASTMKLLVTLAALEELGPAYTWKTRVYADGPIRSGRLEGDLILQGGGDPLLVTESVWTLLRGLRDQGLRHITGDLVVDNRLFDPGVDDPGAFDGRLHRPYNAGPDALLVNFRTVRLQLFPDTDAKQVRVVPDPPLAGVEIDNRLRLTRGRCRRPGAGLDVEILQQRNRLRVRLTGKYPLACGHHVLYRSLSTAPGLAYGVIKGLWTELGGELAGGLRLGAAPAEAKPLYVHESRPLADAARAINKFSNNVMARQLLLTLGVEALGAPGTPEKGRTAINAWLRGRGLAVPGLVLDNGAGLSRKARISARGLGRLLLAAWDSPFMPEFLASLPLTGQDGTLRRRYRDEPLAGRGRFKTGTLNDVKTLAGYLHSRTGRRYAVVLFHNRPGIHGAAGQAVQDALLHWLYRF